MKKLIFAASLLALAGAANADTIDFSQFGPAGSSLPNVINGFTGGGVGITVTGPGQGFSELQQGSTWDGNFPANTVILFTNYAGGAVKIDFASDISSITQLALQSNAYGNYTATLTAYLDGALVGSTSFSALSSGAVGTVPAFSFSAAAFDSIVLTTTNDSVGFAMGGAGGDGGYAGAVPEPMTWALMVAGFGLVGSSMRRRRAVVSFA